MHPLVQVVVLNWNGLEDTLRCVRSLENQTYPNYSVLVVDNGSTDGSPDGLQALGERARLILLKDNLGYTGGNNFAMQDAFANGASYVWLFNSDATADRDALAKLVAACEQDPAIGLASPLVLEADNHAAIQFACGLFDLAAPGYTPSYDIAEAQNWQAQHPTRIALHGTALLVRRSLYEAVGGLDDTFFAYWEDIEYSMRCAAAGFRAVAVLDTAIYHESKPTYTDPASVKPHYYYFVSRNELLMWRTVSSGRQFAKAAAWTVQRQLRQIARMPGYSAGIDAVLAGLWHGLRGISGRYRPERGMPRVLRMLLGRNPNLWIRLLGGRPVGPR